MEESLSEAACASCLLLRWNSTGSTQHILRILAQAPRPESPWGYELLAWFPARDQLQRTTQAIVP